MVIESNKKRNNLLGAIGLAIGILFFVLTGKIENPSRNQRAAFLMGLMFASLGGLTLLNQDERKTEIQAEKKRLIYTQKSLFGGEEIRVIPFDQVQYVGVTSLGVRRVGRTPSYFIYVKLKEGPAIRTGYISFAEYETKELAAEMARTMGCEHSPVPIPPLETELIENAILAGFLAAITWALVYRWKVGPWCAAMWFGTGPAFFMLSEFLGLCYFLNFFRRKYKT